jgi:hypothetical protein
MTLYQVLLLIVMFAIRADINHVAFAYDLSHSTTQRHIASKEHHTAAHSITQHYTASHSTTQYYAAPGQHHTALGQHHTAPEQNENSTIEHFTA